MAADQWKRDYRFHRTNQLARRWLVKVYSPSGVGGRELSQFEVLRRRRTAHTTEHASNKAQFIISQPVVKARGKKNKTCSSKCHRSLLVLLVGISIVSILESCFYNTHFVPSDQFESFSSSSSLQSSV
ncbi:hypothetical protein T4E_6969 [Trichinella pseudospiralis]|uniref:Uncharacterized protein n=1 Tax=Trichinella pseudospiralis TaxID=6337 RepID=A0A0V0XNX1_TRIPS|nr:hypothetical protein T4E_6969 [Trichinella pseudospiralis]